jgi:PAS domain S-box-containing protein
MSPRGSIDAAPPRPTDEGLVDAFNIALQLAFIVIFGVVLVRYWREPRAVHRDLVLVFASVVVLFAINILVRLAPGLPRGVALLGSVALLLQPYLTLRLARHFAPVSRRTLIAALIWFGGSVVGIAIGTRGNPPLALFVVGYFVTVETAAAVLLLRASRRRVGYARTRLLTAGVATVAFAAAVLVLGVGSAMTPGTGTVDPGITFVGRVLALLAGLGYLAAFLPPSQLRRLQQRATAFDMGQAVLGAPVGDDPDALWVGLASAARRITNGPSAAIVLGTPPTVRIVDGTPSSGIAVGDSFEVRGGGESERRSAGPTMVLPIESDLARQGWLIVDADPGSLFLDDDRVLLGYLATQVARAAERRDAIHQRGILASELEDASHELATSRAQLESEARFRAALEAHPGILLVMEPDGRVGYANEQALRALGYTAADIRLRHLSELIAHDLDATGGANGTGEARRQDGSSFAVDYAISGFQAQGQRSSVAVLTDISDRLEAHHLRDTFIGILSHELRTPVTAIYGGSQVLLGRGERLDPGVVRELVTDIAAESERLHRLIENLLVLARVERGEDLLGGEPVLLQRVLPSIVERERSLWLGTQIKATVPSGLPTVRGHDGYVSQVIRNLLSNAVKYGGDGATVEILVAGDADGVNVRVLDDGPGIDADDAERLFDLYYRSPGSAIRAPGAGIGLFVCRRIVTALGGTIWARTRPTGGAEFGFRLPIYAADEDVVSIAGSDEELATAS